MSLKSEQFDYSSAHAKCDLQGRPVVLYPFDRLSDVTLGGLNGAEETIHIKTCGGCQDLMQSVAGALPEGCLLYHIATLEHGLDEEIHVTHCEADIARSHTLSNN